jgi:Pyruvate/2-oxoacid:ferredoxin oxidoreductase gamma subunit
VEREVLLTGIGGQGVQLCATTIGVAAAASDLEVLVFGSYGGSMRGGPTAATVIVGDEALQTPPEVDTAWSAIALHPDYWSEVRERLLPGGLVVVDTSVFRGPVDVPEGTTVVDVPATTMAAEGGFPRAASMVALGAFASATRLVELDALAAAARQVLPSYRAQHAESNVRALTAGWELVGDVVAPAWPVGVGA